MNRTPPRRILPTLCLALWAAAGPSSGQLPIQTVPASAGDTLLERAASVLAQRLYDPALRARVPELLESLEADAAPDQDLTTQRQLAHELLSGLPVSHLGILSAGTHQSFVDELLNKSAPTLGLQLVRHGEGYFATWVLEGGPAARAGIARGHRIVTLDGVPVSQSERLDWRSDDSALPDPPIHRVIVEDGDTVTLGITDRRDLSSEAPDPEVTELEVTAELYSAFQAARESIALHEIGGSKIGYVHLWLIHVFELESLLKETLTGPLAEADALVLDLRGRGGSAAAVPQLLGLFEGPEATWQRPVVALFDRHSRSAKDILAYELRERELALLVGEATAGAVVPATFADLGNDTILMYPSFALPRYTSILEGRGVEPHVRVEVSEPFEPGTDPILERGLSEAARLAASLVP